MGRQLCDTVGLPEPSVAAEESARQTLEQVNILDSVFTLFLAVLGDTPESAGSELCTNSVDDRLINWHSILRMASLLPLEGNFCHGKILFC